MGVDSNQVVDDAAKLAKDAVAADAGKGVLSFVKSKEFWLNAAAVGGTYLQYIPSKYAPYVIVGVNALLHFLNQ